jgi:hypothetical protein
MFLKEYYNSLIQSERKAMTEKETSGLLTLCEDFTALTDEHKQVALAVFQGLLQTQEDAGFERKQGIVVPVEQQEWSVGGGTNQLGKMFFSCEGKDEW